MAARSGLPGLCNGTEPVARCAALGGGMIAISERDGLPGSATLIVRPLSIVPEGDEFIVGHAERSAYVVLPAIGVQVLALLREGRTLDEVAQEAGRAAGEDVDVAAFTDSLLELGFATLSDGQEEADHGEGQTLSVSRWLHACFSPIAWVFYSLCAVGAAVLLALDPGLFPTASDIF